jgi:hypothetical protein
MILDDDEYKKETRNIYAQQQLEAISEIDYLARLASNSNDEDEDNDPRSRGKNKKASGADKDMLNMRFKAAQMKRELIAAMNEDAVSERQVLPMLYVAVTAEEFARFDTVEDHTGTDDACLDELDDHKELLPEGVSGSVQTHGHNRQQEVDDFYDIDLNTGEVIER